MDQDYSESPTVQDTEEIHIPSELPVLPLKDIVTYPYMIVPLLVTREKSILAIEQSVAQDRLTLMVSQRDPEMEDPGPEDMFPIGTVGVIMRMIRLPDDKLRILVQGLTRARLRRCYAKAGCLRAKIETIGEPIAPQLLEAEALVRSVRNNLQAASQLGKEFSPEVMVVLQNLDDLGRLADLAASNLQLSVEEGQSVLETIDPFKRLQKVNELLARELELLAVQNRISSQAKDEIEKGQREYFLRQQMKAIRSELGEGNELAEEIESYRERLQEAQFPEEARNETSRQIERLERLHPDSAETGTVRNFLEWIFSLPWSQTTPDRLDLRKAKRILDADHYNLEEVKTRIIEYLAVLKLKKNLKGPILCLVGPPGVGKTSLGRSVARALGRNFVRLSLGGIHDEAEIRGHRRTYVGAMPGRIIQSMRLAGSNNPVLMLDEVDKIGSDFRGDPASALLEVLDPEQNYSFRDNFLGVPFDLSRVLFITTANLLDPIHPAFKDRLEVIRLSGYSEEEKLRIARRYILPKQLDAHGLARKDLNLTDSGLRTIISSYTREAGLRNLERELASICRKLARKVAEGTLGPFRISRNDVFGYLGVEKILSNPGLREERVGIATGLAWTPTGGEVLLIEVIKMKGKGQLLLTGQLGDVMKESAQAAMSYARARADQFKIDVNFFENHDFHVHIPEGAIPKDGPSAGIALAAALVSLCTNSKLRSDVALTGEISLTGRILPVGGVKEKLLAARRARIKTVVIPKANKKDLASLPQELERDLKIITAESLDEALRVALRDTLSV
jgi:ATP-dependent Lon protease